MYLATKAFVPILLNRVHPWVQRAYCFFGNLDVRIRELGPDVDGGGDDIALPQYSKKS